MDKFQELRNKMVDSQLISRGIQSPAVLDAMRNVPRHLFVPEKLHKSAYDDSPLPIGSGQTISQPYIVALMTEQLEPAPGKKILEIGTGSGYQAAVLAYLGCEVYSIELLDELAAAAQIILSHLKLHNVTIKHGDGYLGWEEKAPFDSIIVTAAPEYIPPGLIKQLKEGGKMIVPVGKPHAIQSLRLINKKDGKIIEKELCSVRFVPMVAS